MLDQINSINDILGTQGLFLSEIVVLIICGTLVYQLNKLASIVRPGLSRTLKNLADAREKEVVVILEFLLRKIVEGENFKSQDFLRYVEQKVHSYLSDKEDREAK
jgi:hypothetical protein